jgi:hypothetical protein
MNANFIPNLFPSPQPDSPDDSDDDFNVVGGEIYATFSPWASWMSVGNPFGAPSVSAPALASAGATTIAGGLDPGSVVAVSSGGITINLIFDAAALAAPASFRAGIQQAVAILAAAISDKITVNLKIDYSGTGGGASAGPDHGVFENYSLVRANLINGATPGDTTFNALTSGTSIQGQSSVAVWNAQLKLWGLMGANDTTTDDGSATFATDINSNLLVGVALHELTHAMGRVPYGSQPDVFDLFRFTSAGTRLFLNGATAPAAYFSLDGGNTKVADYGRNSDPSDFLNSGVQGPNDPFNEFYNGATAQQLTTADLRQLDALGFHLSVSDAQAPTVSVNNPITIQVGSTQLITASMLSTVDNVSTSAQLVYTVTTGPAHGALLRSGTATSTFTQTDLNNGLVSYHEIASGVMTDSFVFRVTDAAGNATAATSFQIYVASLNHAPVLTVPASSISVSAGQTLQVSSLFSATDADNDALTYYFYDNSSAANSGHFVLNGTPVPAATSFGVSAAQLAQLVFVAGAADTSDDLSVQLSDGHAVSAVGQLHVYVDHAPVLTAPASNISVSAGQTLQASSLFSATDADNDTLTYYFYDNSTAANSGHFVLNGTPVPAATSFGVSAAQLAQLTFVAGAANTADDLSIQLSDGHAVSAIGQFHVYVDHAPVLTVPASNISANVGQTLQVSSLFSATDADNDALTYYFYDNSPAANSGHFVLNGTAIPDATSFGVSAAQLAQLVFMAGAAGTSDDLSIQLSDGHAVSGVGQFHVNVNHAPADETLSGGVIAENSPNGTVVGAVAGSDPDSGAVLTYSLTSDADGRFLIDAHTGQLTVADGSQLDYEVATSYGIVVRTVDQGGLFLDKAFTIHLTDVAGVTLNGDGGPNTLVGTAEADTINGLGGNDTLTGGGGNDAIDGGAGIDTAVFSGNLADYQVTYNSAAHTFTVADQRPGSHDGTDSVANVERFQFADSLTTNSFDGAGALMSETFANANGSHWANVFDTVGDQAFVWSTTGYDAKGNLISQSGLNHDGSHWLTIDDVSNQYGWTEATIHFDADWKETSVTGTRDDGSHSVTMQELSAALDTATWYATPYHTNLNPGASTTTGGTVALTGPLGPSGNSSDPEVLAGDPDPTGVPDLHGMHVVGPAEYFLV